MSQTFVADGENYASGVNYGVPVWFASSSNTLKPGNLDASGYLKVNVATGSIALESSAIYAGGTSLLPKFAAIAAATSGGNTLVAAVSSKKIRVLALMILAGAAGNIYFNSGAAGTVIFGGSTNKINLPANGGFVLPFSPVGWFETAAGSLLELQASSTGPFSGGLVYIEV